MPPPTARAQLAAFGFALFFRATVLALLAYSVLFSFDLLIQAKSSVIIESSLFGLLLPTLWLAPKLSYWVQRTWAGRATLASAVLPVMSLAILQSDEGNMGGLFLVALCTLEMAWFAIYYVARLQSLVSVAGWRLQTVLAASATALALGVILGLRLMAEGGTFRIALYFSLASFGMTWLAVWRAVALPAPSGFIRTFLEGTQGITRRHFSRYSLIGLGFAFLVLELSGFLWVWLEGHSRHETVREAYFWIQNTAIWFGVAFIAGCWVVGLHWHIFRCCMWITSAAFGCMVAAILLLATDYLLLPMMILGLCLGTLITSFVHFLLVWTNEAHQGTVGSWIVVLLTGSLFISLGFLAFADRSSSLPALRWVLLGITIFCAITSWLVFFRPWLEGMVGFIFAVMYRISAKGPGLDQMPTQGPGLIVANHAAWLDPLWLSKVVPMPTTPMMTSKFYDLPVISRIMRIMGTIRVPDVGLRKEAPEINEAIAALDRGETVVIFAEGYLRRKDEIPLRRFGRGVWQILSARPNTPVYPCWIEGGWGSFFSHFGGKPPTKNKKFDLWHRVRLGILGPVTLDPKLLQDHMATRVFLMNQVSQARTPLGLEALPKFTVSEAGEEE